MAKKKKDTVIQAKITFDPSERQRDIVKYCEFGNGIQFVAVSTGRQVGKTTIAIVIAAKWFLENAGIHIGIFLPINKQCKNVFNRLESSLNELIVAKEVKVNKTDLTFTSSSGSVIKFLGSDNDSVRGFTFDAVIIDEANFIKNEIFQAAIQPTFSVSLSKKNEEGLVGFNGKVLMLSTPKTKNWFYGFVMNEHGNKRYKTVRFTSEEGGLISKEFLAQVKKELPDYIYKNEYMGEFLDSGAGIFKYLNCILNVDSKEGFYAGLDVASVTDYMSLTIQNRKGNVIFQGRWTGQSYNVLLDTVAEVLKEYGNPVCYVETNGVGQVPIELLRDAGCRVQEWHTSNQSKNDIIMRLASDFNLNRLTILDIEHVKEELDNFTVEYNKNGKAIYGGSNGYHDDTVMSLAICNYNRKHTIDSKPALIKPKRIRSL